MRETGSDVGLFSFDPRGFYAVERKGMGMSATFETPRLHVREIRPGDGALVCAYYVRNEARFVRWDPPRSHAAAAYESFIANVSRSHDPLVLLAFDRAAPGTLVGEVILSAFSRETSSASIAYTVDGAYEGRGYACEAVVGAVAFAFETLGLRAIEATYDPDNVRSENLLVRAGFELAGRSVVVPGLERSMRADARAIRTH